MLSGVEIKYKETDLQKKSGLGGKDELFFTLIVKKPKRTLLLPFLLCSTCRRSRIARNGF